MTRRLDPRPWTGLPPAAAAALRPALADLAEEIIDAISHGVPDYARPLEGPFGEALRAGVEEALRRFLEMVERADASSDAGRGLYVDLGRGEMLAGRSLDALLAAYRLGARVAWRRLAGAGERAGLDPRTLYLLAESIFAYIDELSAASIEGYALEQAAAAGERSRRRRRLAALLVQEPPADRAAVEDAAAAAGWALPDRLAAVAVADPGGERAALSLGEGAIAAPLGPLHVALVPDPGAPGRRAQLEAAFSDRRGAIGPAMPWRAAAVSAGRAAAALTLAGEGTIEAPAFGLIDSERHGVALVLGADRGLARDLAARALAPLQGETPASRGRLQETLRAWLRHRGRTERAAAELHVHPQTVRYRLGRLRELFGERLDDPDARFELELALRAVPPAGRG